MDKEETDVDKKKIVLNSIRCNHCGDVIVSRSRHNYVTCGCGKCSVDGGNEYLRRCAASPDDYTELSRCGDGYVEIHAGTDS